MMNIAITKEIGMLRDIEELLPKEYKCMVHHYDKTPRGICKLKLDVEHNDEWLMIEADAKYTIDDIVKTTITMMATLGVTESPESDLTIF